MSTSNDTTTYYVVVLLLFIPILFVSIWVGLSIRQKKLRLKQRQALHLKLEDAVVVIGGSTLGPGSWSSQVTTSEEFFRLSLDSFRSDLDDRSDAIVGSDAILSDQISSLQPLPRTHTM